MTSGNNINTAETGITTYLLFALVCIASFQAGKFSTLLSIPKITLYLATGMIFGPFGVGLLSFTSARTTLSPISSIALAFICISAGAELTYSQLRPILKRILASTLAVSALVFTATLGAFIALSSPGKGLLPTSIEALPPPCRDAIGGLMGAVAFSFSPAATMAMVREARASGVFTSTLLGVTILADVLVLLVFALARGVTENECHYYDTLIPSATAPPTASAASLPPASSAAPLTLLPSSPSLTMASTAASAAAATLQAIPSGGGGGGGDTSLHHPSGPDLTSSLTMLLASLGVGVVVGGAIVLYLRARHPTTPLVILALGAAVFYTSGALSLPSSPSLSTPTPAPAAPPGHYTPHHLPLEPLLVCVIAGAVGINWSGMNADFLSHTLETLGPLVYIPFFTVTGAGLDLSTLAASVAFALVFAALRVACIGIALGGVAAAFASSSPPAIGNSSGGGGGGSGSGGGGSGSSSQISSLPLPVSSHPLGAAAANGGGGGGYWGAHLAGVGGGGGFISTSNPLPLTAALVTQAGVSIGLAGEIGRHFPGWGRDAETAIVSVVLINQAIGPFLCSWALKVSGDAGKDVGGVGGGGGVGEGVEDGGKEGPGGAVVTLTARLGELTILGLKSLGASGIGHPSPESPSSK